jgi:hypothetical protein
MRKQRDEVIFLKTSELVRGGAVIQIPSLPRQGHSRPFPPERLLGELSAPRVLIRENFAPIPND